MADKISKNQRSEIMRSVKSKDTKMEIAFRKAIWQKGFRYSKNSSKYFGKPDLVFKKYKTVIFLDSCFWHGCKQHCRIPTTRKKYWAEKIERNKNRDKEVKRFYAKNGWNIVRVWEHEIKKDLNGVVLNIIQKIKNHEIHQ